MTRKKNEKLEQQLVDWKELRNLGQSLIKKIGGVQQNVAIEIYHGKLKNYFLNYGSFNVNKRPVKYSGKK